MRSYKQISMSIELLNSQDYCKVAEALGCDRSKVSEMYECDSIRHALLTVAKLSAKGVKLRLVMHFEMRRRDSVYSYVNQLCKAIEAERGKLDQTYTKFGGDAQVCFTDRLLAIVRRDIDVWKDMRNVKAVGNTVINFRI